MWFNPGVEVAMTDADFRILDALMRLPFYRQHIRGKGSRLTRPAFKSTSDGCIVYDGSLNKKGYGRRGNGSLVHRTAWEELVGPIPDGYDVHHGCRNRSCSRLDHLICLSREAHALLEGRPRKLTATQVEEILLLIAAGTPHAEIAARFNVVRPYISLIKFGKRWASVVRPFWNRQRSGVAGEIQRQDQLAA
jgi:hypothetical protein